MSEKQEPAWAQPMPDEQFETMRRILAAPSPIGLEAAMTRGVLEPYFASFMPDDWAIHRFKGNAGIVLDTHPGRDDLFSAMIIGHADKIRLQVRSIGKDGKIWVNSDSFLPSTLIGHEVQLFTQAKGEPGRYQTIEGGTIEAVGAIHFADAKLRSGVSGIKPNMLYLELHLHGGKRQEQVEALGIQAGDPILLRRPIRRGFAANTFYGAYLDNGIGCFVTAEVARLVAESGGLENLRLLFAIASHEEIGRMGSRVMAGELRPDAVFGVDVSHDFEAAPNISSRRMTPITMGKGFSHVHGAVASAQLNALVERAADEAGIPHQRFVSGRDTGTDAMAGFFAAIDAATVSVGVPVRNMHTISEVGHTGDVLAAIHGIHATLRAMSAFNDGAGMTADDLREGHPRLDLASEVESLAE